MTNRQRATGEYLDGPDQRNEACSRCTMATPERSTVLSRATEGVSTSMPVTRAHSVSSIVSVRVSNCDLSLCQIIWPRFT